MHDTIDVVRLMFLTKGSQCPTSLSGPGWWMRGTIIMALSMMVSPTPS